MDLTGLSDFISNVGFPIVCVVCLFYTMQKEQEYHKRECDNLLKAINDNRLVMQELLDFKKAKNDDED